MRYRLLLYLPEPLTSPTLPLLLREEGGWTIALLDDHLKPVRCYAGLANPVACGEPFSELRGEELLVTGGAAAEVIASQLGAVYVDERLARLADVFHPGITGSLHAAVLEVLGRRGESPILRDTMLIVLPGSHMRAWAVGLASKLEGGRASLKALFSFSEKLVTRYRFGESWEPIKRFGSWWSVPWHMVFSLGRNLRRALEVVVERPVERLPGTLAAKDPEELVEEAARAAESRYTAPLGRRSPRKAIVYIDEELYKPQGGYVAVVVSKNYQRRVIARWYFNRKFELVGFDSTPPEAVSSVDAEIAVGDVPREVQARLTSAGAILVTRAAVLSPARIEDYIAIKAVRWYENAAL
ncbi:MAG: hypothetical protein QXS92_01605 [Thermofilum sp.]